MTRPNPEIIPTALFHAFSQDINRLPPHMRGQYDPAQMAIDYSAGIIGPADELRTLAAIGSPWFEPDDDYNDYVNNLSPGLDSKKLQEAMLSGYRGDAWLPDQVKALGRQPEPYELSPGGKLSSQIDRRQRLYQTVGDNRPSPLAQTAPEAKADSEMRPWTGAQSWSETPGDTSLHPWTGQPQIDRAIGAADLYMKEHDSDKHNWLDSDSWANELFNPENWLGTFTTQMGPVISDAASHAGDKAFRQGIAGSWANPLEWGESYGDAATRAGAAQWNRTSPQITQDQGSWLANNELVSKGRLAHRNSEGMTSGDTFRRAFGDYLPESWNGRVPYVQPAINAGMSLGNSLLDMSSFGLTPKAIPNMVRSAAVGAARSRIPGVTRFATSVADDIGRHQIAKPKWISRLAHNLSDEALDPGAVGQIGIEAFASAQNESKDDFNRRIADEEKDRRQNMNAAHSLQGHVVTPQYGPSSWIRKALITPSAATGKMIDRVKSSNAWSK